MAAPIANLDGLFVGQLDAAEMAAFERAVAEGHADRSYEGASGFLGLAKVRVRRAAAAEAAIAKAEGR